VTTSPSQGGGRARGAQSGGRAPHPGSGLGTPSLAAHPGSSAEVWQRMASPPHSSRASVSHSVRSQQSLVLLPSPAEKAPGLLLPFGSSDGQASAAGTGAGGSPAAAPVWSWPGQHHRLGEQSVPKRHRKPKGHRHEGGQGWDWLSGPLCTPKPRTARHRIPSQRLCVPKAPAKSKYFPVFLCRGQCGYRKQLCQTNLTSFVEEIFKLIWKIIKKI